MARLSVNLHRMRAHLKRGGVIAYPTESCYGLGCVPTAHHAVRCVIKMKKRPQDKGLIVIGRDLMQLEVLLKKLPESTKQYLNSVWAAPTTFVLPVRENIPSVLRGRGRDKLAVRVPAHDLARSLCNVVNTALVSTSCNRAGKRPCKTVREVNRQFGRSVLIVRGRVGNRKHPSDIIDLTTRSQLR